ncbi:MAG: type II toxin-antitoxin system RelE/ParE family toxin [Proteobacteria bacterium]|nr:type II toxin-antitoxin system RelE/ParE family toxin [Pseudomonadota bacterium]
MKRVTFHKLAKRELVEAIRFYGESGRGNALLQHVRGTILRLRRFPKSAPCIRGPIRRAVLTKFPYNLLYSIEGDYIHILAIAHQRRDPMYWVDREQPQLSLHSRTPCPHSAKETASPTSTGKW